MVELVEHRTPKNMKLKGINLGGWLLMEGYILAGRNIPEHRFKKEFASKYGQKELVRFEKLFRSNFIDEDDFRRISRLGANCLRVPFSFNLLEKKPFVCDSRDFGYLDAVFCWADKYKLKVILDLHAACGAQNCDWHADSAGSAYLWKRRIFRERTYRLWEAVAARYKDKPALYGYDVLNEPVVSQEMIPLLKDFYRIVIKRLKAVDKKHTIFIEGNLWAQRIDFLKELLQDNVAVSIHSYQPLNFAFNFVPYLSYPGRVDGIRWSKTKLFRYLLPYYNFSRRNKVNIFVGEFGVNYRGNCAGEMNYLKDILDVFNNYGFSYT